MNEQELELDLREGWVEPALAEEFPELGLTYTPLEARPGSSPVSVKRRLRGLADRYTGSKVVHMRQDPVPWAYRVFARRLGIDPDGAESAVEAAALQQHTDLHAAGSLPEDAQLIGVAETGVPVLAFDADKLDGELWLRRAIPGERIGDHAIEPGRPVLADSTRVLAAPFGQIDAAAAVMEETERMTFVALQVKGVPDVGVEEALWTVVEIARAAR